MLFDKATVAATLLSAVNAVDLSARATGTLDEYLASESPVAVQGILDNIGSDGRLVKGADAGIVVASPSTADPDYFYTWTRDAALTFKYLIESGNSSMQSLIEEYIIAQGQLQTVDNPSGDFASGAGLAEPKYYTNKTAFLGDWGRPQRDGPALRATALIAFANDKLKLNQSQTVREIIWPVVQNDLAYVAQYWNESGFDLWEEVNGSSFFTTATQHRALVEGAAFAAALNESCPACESQAPQILCFQQDYWNGNNIISNMDVQQENFDRSGLDCNSILASIHVFDSSSDGGCDSTTFQPCSERALANHKTVVDSFRQEYTINANATAGKAAAIGRYSEDVYQGGHPWYLCTFAAAEQLYDALYTYNQIGNINVTDVSRPFFNDLVPDIATGTYAKDSDEYKSISTAMKNYADGFVSINQQYTPANGSLAEQYSRENGTALSARDLTWSYASFLSMQRAREGKVSPSWGASKAAAVLPNRCERGSVQGTYATPTATAFPQSEEGTWVSSGNSDGSSTGTSSGTAQSPAASKSAGNRLRPFSFF